MKWLKSLNPYFIFTFNVYFVRSAIETYLFRIWDIGIQFTKKIQVFILNFKSISRHLRLKFIWVNLMTKISPENFFFLQKISLSDLYLTPPHSLMPSLSHVIYLSLWFVLSGHLSHARHLSLFWSVHLSLSRHLSLYNVWGMATDRWNQNTCYIGNIMLSLQLLLPEPMYQNFHFRNKKSGVVNL